MPTDPRPTPPPWRPSAWQLDSDLDRPAKPTADWYVRQIIEGRMLAAYLAAEDAWESRYPDDPSGNIPDTAVISDTGDISGWDDASDEDYRNVLWRHVSGLLQAVLRLRPAITKAEVLAFIDQAWPTASTRQGRHPALEDTRRIGLAHDALIQEEPEKYNCRTACLELAERLGVDPRTIYRVVRPRPTTSAKKTPKKKRPTR